MPVPGFTEDALRKWRLKRPNVAVAIPMTEFVYRTAFWNFGFLFRDGLKHGDILIPTIQSAVPAEARNSIISAFLKTPAHVKYLLMFDSDMVVPIDAIDAMSGYDLPFVSGYCTLKQYPYTPVASVKAEAHTFNGEVAQGYRYITGWEPFSGIHECDATGAAALCLRRDLLEALEAPYFKHEGGGEDYYFCRKVQQVTTLKGYPDGVPILISTDINVGHIGETVAFPRMWFDNKEKYYADNPDKAETDTPLYGITGKDTDTLLTESVG